MHTELAHVNGKISRKRAVHYCKYTSQWKRGTRASLFVISPIILSKQVRCPAMRIVAKQNALDNVKSKFSNLLVEYLCVIIMLLLIKLF